MYKKFRVQNFMCLKDVTVDLEPLTVFIGPNSAGKSAFFKALSTFSRILWYPVHGGKSGDFYVEHGVGFDEAVWKGDTGLPIVFEVWMGDNGSTEADYTIELRRSYLGWSVTAERFQFRGQWLDTRGGFEFETSQGPKAWPGPYKAPLAYLASPFSQDPLAGPYLQSLQELRRSLGPARRYRPGASDIATSTRVQADVATGSQRREAIDVDETGRNLVLALRDLLLTKREIFTAIETDLSALHEHIRGIGFKSDWRGLSLTFKSERTMQETPATLESDGVLLSTFLLWRLHSSTPNLKVCLEEPENGVHVSALEPRYQLIKRFTTGTDPSRVQILVATHSRDFLNAIKARADILNEVRVVEFSPSEGTAIHRLEHYREINQLLDACKGQLGDLWWSGRLDNRLRPSG
jgi:predicted ATPase